MLFSSITFLYYFLPIVFFVYLMVPKSWKNAVLLISSLFFYAWGEPKYVILMVVSILCSYLFGLLIQRTRHRRCCPAILFLAVTVSLSFLVYFKYADFFIGSFSALTGRELPLLQLALPVGISFYTFQLISYTVDVYRGTPAQRNLLHLALYIAMFPQLIAGPIVRYDQIAPQLTQRSCTLTKTAQGLTRFLCGLGKKVLIANQLGALCAAFELATDRSLLFYWIYALAFALQIYFDFSGYSDMAIGLGKLFGFQFAENFNYPFTAKSVTEFWRRWHISLGSWFRDYVYIPLGGNRTALPRWILNLLLVWFLTGFWHGASWNFIFWGLFYVPFLLLEKWILGGFLKKHACLGHLYVIMIVLISFTFFHADTMGTVFANLSGMFTPGQLSSPETCYYLQSYAPLLVVAIIGATPLPKWGASKLPQQLRQILTPVVLALLLLVSTAFLVDGSFNPFLYFRF